MQFITQRAHISPSKLPPPARFRHPIRRCCHTIPVNTCYRIVGELSGCGLVGWSDGTDCVMLHAPAGGLSLARYELATD